MLGMGSMRRSNKGSIRRSSKSMPRSESAPLLAPLWEPSDDVHELDAPPSLLGSSASADHSGPKLNGFADSHGGDVSHSLPDAWQALLGAVSAISASSEHFDERLLANLTQSELVAAAHESLLDSVPLRLDFGVLDQFYVMKKELSACTDFKVLEGVERSTHKNFSLKIVPRAKGRRLRAVKPLEPLQVSYLIMSFVHEVYVHPNYVCVCLKWGMHEIDSSHQLSAWIVEASHLLDELVQSHPSLTASSRRYLRLSAKELQRLLLRTACLDLYLNSNLWLPA